VSWKEMLSVASARSTPSSRRRKRPARDYSGRPQSQGGGLGRAGRSGGEISVAEEALASVHASRRPHFWESELHRVRGVLLLQEDAADADGELSLKTALEVARAKHAG
jgi:hypothetical protein